MVFPMFHESDLLEKEVERYSRQIIVPGIDIEGQKKLREKSILIVGCGGLGCPVILYLATCGIVKLGIADHDRIEVHNLQRQVLFKEEDINSYKVEVARDNIIRMNHMINVVAYRQKVDSSNVKEIIRDYDYVLDCTDNIETRYCLSDTCRLLKKDFLCASVLRWEGHLYVLPYSGPCYRCIYPVIKKKTTSCDESGIIGPICGMFGSLLCLELIKLINKASSTKMIYYNGYTNLYHNIKLREVNCDVCRLNIPIEYSQTKEATTCLDIVDRHSDENIPELTWSQVLERRQEFTIVDVRNNVHFRMFRIKESVNYPLKDIEENINDIPQSRNIAVTCKKGIRSKSAVKMLRKYNLEAFSIVGGIDEYIKQYIKK